MQYQLFRSTTPGFTPSSANLVITTSATGYSDVGLTEATAYYYVVEATNTNGSSSPSNQVTAQTGGPGSITAVSGSNQTAQVGTAFANPLVVSVQDAESNPVAGVTVTFVGTGLTFPSGATAVTDSNGQAQVIAQPSSSGTLTISANVAGLSAPASFSETGTAIPQTITFGPLSQVTYGTGPITLSATASSNLPLSFTVAGPATVSGSVLTITGAGQVTVTANQAGDTTYAAASPVSQSFTVAQAASTVTWATPAAITYGTALSASQLNATASVPGTFTYSPASGTLAAGTHTLSVTFTPTDTANYATNTVTVVLQVNRATPNITWATPATITYGTTLSPSQLNPTASVPGSFTYSPASGVALGAGAQTLSATFTPADIANYTTANASVLQRVNPAVLTVTANSLSAPFGTPPMLGATITGFVNGDSSSAVSGAPALATTANALSLPGTYPITIGTGSLSAVNYIFSFVGGTYNVTFTGSVPAAGTQCNGAYNGSFSGNITVSANQICVFVGGSVGGNLHLTNGTVELVHTRLGGDLQISGGTFSITSGTTIAGNLQVQGTPASSATSHVCGTAVKGDLTLQNNGTPVLVGTTDGSSCPGNTVQGNVTVQSNTALVSVLGNTISDNLTVQTNSASTVVNGNTLQGNLVDKNNTADTEVFTNQVRGNLQCSGNTSITGGSNVAASKHGQCANF
ncbi:beta strand repeat-containing protein [Tunturiibacter gelidiferens]|uniref:beta strand repeat-containing protein n=1 Tax=Tunturiibacter gelidiferens TaxID=3069689 RepID=UPI003D9BF1B7